MRRRLLTVTLAILMVLSLAACGSDKKDSDETDAMNTEEEETTVEESAEETSEKETVEETVEEPDTEEPAVEEETKTTEYQLTQMNTGFYGGIAWAAVETDTGAKSVLINKDLQIVYELSEGMYAGDIFDGKAVVITNPGFMILGADGTVLYECSDNLVGNLPECAVSLTKDGGAVYNKLEEGGLTSEASYYACVLNDKFETVAQMEIPFEEYPQGRWLYLSDGVYGYSNSYGYSGMLEYILNVKDNLVLDNIGLEIQGYSYAPVVMWDTDRCVGLSGIYNENYDVFFTNAENLDFSGITDIDTLYNLLCANTKTSEFESFESKDYFVFNHGYIFYGYGLEGGIEGIEGVAVPDFGARISRFGLSNDGKYIALELEGADGNIYYTVINSDGQALYEPVVSEQFEWVSNNGVSVEFTLPCCVCDGYIMDGNGRGITPDGKVFQLGDGTALSGIGENSVAYGGGYNYGCMMISEGYICSGGLYRLDGTKVTTVTALN